MSGSKPAAASPAAASPAAASPAAASPAAASSAAAAPAAAAPAAAASADAAAGRLVSLDAYRGFIMLAMASSGLGFAQVAKQPEFVERFAGQWLDGPWRWLWRTLAYQFDHVAWTGCAFWDLIQPSFMFMVGVSMPFSNARRAKEGQSVARRFVHVLFRSAVLVGLGVFLSSNGAPLTNFTFVNVLTQIGLGYPFLYLLSEKSGRRDNTERWIWGQLAAAVLVLVAYGAWFASYTPTAEVRAEVEQSLQAAGKTLDPATQFTGWAARWDKHTNAAAAVDRWLLNCFPRAGDTPDKRVFRFNDGGYQTLNFIPSLATMIFGLMAGTMLRSNRPDAAKWKWLLGAAGLCFLATLPIDTTLWPEGLRQLGAQWSLCPAVKRIWTPTWAVFSSGWTFAMLAAFHVVIDRWGYRRWSWPLVVVGVNSISMYCLSQLARPFTKATLKTHLATVDAWFPWDPGLVGVLFGEQCPFTPVFERLAVLFVLWCVCVWLWRQRIFVRI
jgi:predicted acyltransferase